MPVGFWLTKAEGRVAWAALVESASTPYRRAGRYAWHFARAKLRGRGSRVVRRYESAMKIMKVRRTVVGKLHKSDLRAVPGND